MQGLAGGPAGGMRILHAADLHLDSAFAGLAEEKAALLRQESRDILRRMVD